MEGQENTNQSITIVGAGISGLFCAYAAVKRGYHVRIIEKNEQVGGILSTSQVANLGSAESAAHSFFNNFDMEDLCDDIGLELLPAQTKAKKHYLLRKGLPQKWPLDWMESLELLSSFFLHLFSLKPKKHELLSDWSLRVFGGAATQYIVLPAFQGIYGRDPSALSATLLFKRFSLRKKRKIHRKRKLKIKGCVAPKYGMGDLVAKLESYLKTHNADFILSHEFTREELVEVLARNEKIILATPLYVTSQLVADHLPGFAAASSTVHFVDLMNATVFFKREDAWLDGYGILLPRIERYETLGITFNTNTFDNRSSQPEFVSETWIYKDELLKLTDEQVQKLIVAERQRLTSKNVAPLGIKIHRWKKAIPYYDVTLERLLEQESFLSAPSKGIAFSGNWVGALGLGRMLSEHIDTVEKFTGEKFTDPKALEHS